MVDNERIQKAADMIEGFLRLSPNASFAAIEQMMKDNDLVEQYVPGKSNAITSSYQNLVYWVSQNTLLIQAVLKLFAEKRLKRKVVDLLEYEMDGMTLSYPVAEEPKDYFELHWLPVVLTLPGRE